MLPFCKALRCMRACGGCLLSNHELPLPSSFDKPLSSLLLLQDMQIRKSKKQMEMVWRGAESYGKDADVLACNFPSGALL